MRYYPRRVDANQKAVAHALRRAGCTVVLLHTVGQGCPDLLVGVRGATWLVEVKDEESADRLDRGKVAKNAATATRQKEWASAWRGAPPIMVRSPEDALRALGFITQPFEPTGVERFGPQQG